MELEVRPLSDALGAEVLGVDRDGFEIAESLRREDPKACACRTRNGQGFWRQFEDDVDLVAEFPVLSTDEHGHVTGVRINDHVAAPGPSSMYRNR